ncbi:hypothetical protein ILUMI_11783 [Ignelater luminosus]|uniref:Ig-like domain-containing protein n=1 Tax=Ignelater luminosus TaxID=2038154 RepID=A0A8K0GDL5_IGNLU|nr:hypothetical protein ILUMI_11783 [Ignelater luminosus]
MEHLNLNPNAAPFEGISYYGSGLQAGQCGITIDHVKDSHSGQIKCALGIQTELQESSAVMHLTVARPPRPPQLDIIRDSDHFWAYRVGDILHATCIVRDGRPVANISWYLDEEPIPYSQLSPPKIDGDKASDLLSISQNLTKELRPSDNGKALKCVANHPALANNNFVHRQLNVTYPPLPQSNPIDKFGYVLGQNGIIALEIEANPRPHLEWSIRDQVIKEGGHDSTGRIKADEIRDLGKGHYEALLRIADINKHDTEAQYILRAYNDMGNQDYVILISTSPEPEDLDLGVLAIIGIVIAVMIPIVIIFLVIFARITGRWCFSGRGGNVRHTGESSDTESVDVRPKEHKRILPPLKLTTLFKKSEKEKPQDEEERPKSAETVETKIPLEESERQTSTPSEPKEGLVYAELDLVNPNLKPLVKNDDDKTEYAEIVYTQKDTDNANKGHDDNKGAAAS